MIYTFTAVILISHIIIHNGHFHRSDVVICLQNCFVFTHFLHFPWLTDPLYPLIFMYNFELDKFCSFLSFCRICGLKQA